MAAQMSKSSKETFNANGVARAIERLKKRAEVSFGARAGRRDFYSYLADVYGFVLAWNQTNRSNRLRSHLAALMDREGPRANADAFHLALEATCPKSKKTISKFAIALSNAEALHVAPEKFERFLERIGGPTTICIRAAPITLSKIVREAKAARATA